MPGRTPLTPSSVTRRVPSPAVAAPAANSVDASTRSVLTHEIVGSTRAEPAPLHPLGALARAGSLRRRAERVHVARGHPGGSRAAARVIVLGLLALSTTNLRGWLRSVVLEWLPLALVLAAYDLLRGHADTPALLGLVPAAARGRRLPLRRHRPDGLAAGSALARIVGPALVRLRVLDRLRELLRGDVPDRRVALVLRARALSAVRRLRRAARGDGVRHVRALSRRRRRGSRAGKASSSGRRV